MTLKTESNLYITPGLYGYVKKGWGNKMASEIVMRHKEVDAQKDEMAEFLKKYYPAVYSGASLGDTTVADMTHILSFYNVLKGKPDEERISDFFWVFKQPVKDQIIKSASMEVPASMIYKSWFEFQIADRVLKEMINYEVEMNKKFPNRAVRAEYIVKDKVNTAQMILAHASQALDSSGLYNGFNVGEVMEFDEKEKQTALGVIHQIYETIRYSPYIRDNINLPYDGRPIFGSGVVMDIFRDIQKEEFKRQAESISNTLKGFQSIIRNEV